MNRQANEALVNGQLVINAGIPPFHGATAHITLEDISYADAAAVEVAAATIPGISHDPMTGGRDTIIPFVLEAHPAAPPVSARNDYTVRAWIDRDSDGTEGAEDLYSDQSYRVLTRGFGRTVTISLESHSHTSASDQN
jgi:uncharacterized lipoprotein YbaY